MRKNESRGEMLERFPSITKENIRFGGLRPMKVIKGRIIRRNNTGGFVFLSDDGRLTNSRLAFGQSTHLERESLGESLDDQELKMLVKLGVITATEASEAVKKAKANREHWQREDDLKKLEALGAKLGVSATVNGITRELRKSKAAKPAK